MGALAGLLWDATAGWRMGVDLVVTDLTTMADVVDELLLPIHVRERIEYWDDNRNKKIRWHQHTAPPLLTQLHAAVIPGVTYVEDPGLRIRHSPRSVPPARIEAMSAALMLDAGVATWMIELGQKLRDTTADNLRALVGAPTEDDVRKQLLRDGRRWYGWAATLSGWERAPWSPPAPCPLCAEWGTLRVYLARGAATCVACHETWSEAANTLGLLGAHVEPYAKAGPRPVPDTAVEYTRSREDIDRRRRELIRATAEPKPDLPGA